MILKDGELASLLSQAKPRSLPSVLFNLAHVYYLNSTSAWDAMGVARNADFAAPAIMSQSFSIELLLKFFLAIDHPAAATAAALERAGVKLRRHKYTELFDQIAPASKAKIAASFTAISGSATDADGFRAALVKLGDDPFVFWRYIYESQAATPDKLVWLDKRLLDQVTDALGKVAEAELRATAPK